MRKVELKVGSPCSEKWETFEKRGLNGYCHSCAKEVVDFTKMSENEIKGYFKRATGEVCGRMYSRQQKVYSDPSRLKMKPLASVLMTGAALLFTGTSTLAQSKDQMEQTDRKDKHRKNDKRESANQKRTITGTVIDDLGESLPEVKVELKGTTTKTTTDLDGHFSISTDSIGVLVLSFAGFESNEIIIGEKSTIDITMSGVTVLGGIHYRRLSPRSLWWSITGLFRRNH